MFKFMVLLIFIYGMGFFTNLVQIRGVARETYDLYQAFVRMLFNASIGGFMLLLVLRLSGFTFKDKINLFQFVIALIISVGIILVSVYGLRKLPEFLAAYNEISIEDVQIYYPDYQYSDRAFTVGYIVFPLAVLTALSFTAVLLTRFLGGTKVKAASGNKGAV